MRLLAKYLQKMVYRKLRQGKKAFDEAKQEVILAKEKML